MENESKSNSKRDLSLDFLKGSAVFFMIFTHVNAFFYFGTDRGGSLDFFVWWGSTICFVTFLFSYGIGYGLRFAKSTIPVGRTVERLLWLLFGYYLVSIWARSLSLGAFPNINEIARVIFLQDIPGYAEFILPFVFYGFFTLLFFKQLGKILRHQWLILIIALGTYAAAMTLYNLNWGSDLATFAKGLLVGHEGLNRWGLLSFFPILVFGWVWGKDYFSHPKSIFIQRLAFLFLAAGVIIFSLLGFYSERWPPSILYLNWGLAYSFGVLTFWPILKKIKPLVQFGTFAGRHAFAFFVIHTMLVMGVSKIIGYRVYDELSTLILLTTVFIVTSVLILIKEKVETLAFAS